MKTPASDKVCARSRTFLLNILESLRDDRHISFYGVKFNSQPPSFQFHLAKLLFPAWWPPRKEAWVKRRNFRNILLIFRILKSDLKLPSPCELRRSKVATVPPPPPPIFPYNLFRSSMTIFLPGRETKRGKIKVVLFALNGEGGNGPHAGNTRANGTENRRIRKGLGRKRKLIVFSSFGERKWN